MKRNNPKSENDSGHGATTAACPDCGSGDTYELADGRYGCRGCGTYFDEPDWRPTRRPDGGILGGDGMAARLAAADPDDVGGESA
ncbi:hypothetical protein [Halobaculum sp. D14]|uniref:hypothetical protein n=1 Tax=Halobaculum sp. D14 TaxID=3421642 RepID=UPI003EBBE907